jgi:hypothetical protein
MIDWSQSPRHEAPISRRGFALVAVLYFLVLGAIASITVVFSMRAATRRGGNLRTDARLIAAADSIVYGALANWNGPARIRQPVGSTVRLRATRAGQVLDTLWATRLTARIFSVVAAVRAEAGGGARRVALLVRVPVAQPRIRGALVSAVDVSIGPDVRFTIADSASCRDTTAAAVTLAPGAALSLDSGLPNDQRLEVRIDSAAADSAAYLRIANLAWDELARRADVRLAPAAHVAPASVMSGGQCVEGDGNWGDPIDSTSACREHAPLVYAAGDLTIDGGRGQGVLLVDGRLVIAGPFVFSGQIVARGGIETRADEITISGSAFVWRASSDSAHASGSRSDVVLTHETTFRYSRCDVEHGIASWLEPRAVRARAWTELF